MVFSSNTIKRFESKFVKGKPDECWIWRASRFHKTTYGQFKGPECVAHRFSYRLYVGPIPDGLCVLHSCDNPGCVNPNHLFLGTNLDNTADMISKSRDNFHASLGPGEKACKGEDHGRHKLTEKEVLEIRKLYRTFPDPYNRIGYCSNNARCLAIRFGIGVDQISKIVKRRQWKHI